MGEALKILSKAERGLLREAYFISFLRSLVLTSSIRNAFIVIGCFAAVARGQATLDQSLPGTNLATAIVYSGAPAIAAQTFTVGITGLFTGFDLRLGASDVGTPGPDEGNIVLGVRSLVAGVPTLENSAPIVFLTVPVSSLPVGNSFIYPWTHFDLGADAFDVTSGDLLALSICNQSPEGVNGLSGAGNGYGINGTTGPLYAGGAGFEGFYGDAWTPAIFLNDPIQFDFQTYVSPQPVPEPSAIALMAVPIFLLLQRRRATSQNNVR